MSEVRKVYVAKTTFEADMIIERLKAEGIHTFSRSGILKIYANISPTEIYVNERDWTRARELVQDFEKPDTFLEEECSTGRKYSLCPRVVVTILLILIFVLIVFAIVSSII